MKTVSFTPSFPPPLLGRRLKTCDYLIGTQAEDLRLPLGRRLKTCGYLVDVKML